MNNLFEFTPYYKEPTEKYIIITCAIFMREKNYKSHLVYYNGLLNIATNFRQYYKNNNYYLRIYYDNSIESINHLLPENNDYIKKYWLPFIAKLKTIDYVQLVKVKCKIFQKNDVYHYGSFTVFGRYIPMFINNPNIDHIFIIDVDDTLQYGYRLYQKLLPYYNEYNPELVYITIGLRLNEPRHLKYPFHIAGKSFISLTSFPEDIFIKFLTMLHNKQYNKYIIRDFKIKTDTTNIDLDKLMCFAIDEYFLNKFFLKYCYNNEIYTIKLVLTEQIFNDFYWSRYKLVQLQDKDAILLDTTLKNVLGKFYKPTLVNNNINKLNELITQLHNNDSMYLMYRLQIELKKLYKTGDYIKLFITSNIENWLVLDLKIFYKFYRKVIHLHKPYSKEKMILEDYKKIENESK